LRIKRTPHRVVATTVFAWHRLGSPLIAAIALLLLSASAAVAAPWGVDALDMVLPEVLPACTISWDGGAGTTSWLDPANWSGDSLPGPSDDVCIAAATPGAEVVHGVAVMTQVHSIQAAKRLVVSAGGLGATTASTLESLKLTGGTADLDGATELGELQQSGGELSGDGVVTLNGFARTSTWSGGAQRGPGGTVLADGALQMTGATAKSLLAGRILELKDGTDATWTGGDVKLGAGTRLLIDAGSGLHAQPGAGTLTRVPGGGGVVGSVQNAGAYTVATGPGTNHVLGVPLNGSGTIALSNGSALELRAGGRQTGTVDFAAGSELLLSDGNDLLDGAVLVSGGGRRGKLTVSGTAEAVLDGGPGFSYLVHDLNVAAGKLTLGAAVDVQRFEQAGGELTGKGKLTVTEVCIWTGGTQSGAIADGAAAGETLVTASARGGLDGNTTKVLSGRTLKIAAFAHGFSWEAGDVELRAGAAIRNTGHLYLASVSGHIRAGPGGGTVVIEPGGLISVLASAYIDAPLDVAHGSTIDVGSDVLVGLSLTGGVSHGKIALNRGVVVHFNGYSLASDSELTGEEFALVSFDSGVVDVAGTVDVTMADVSGGQLTFAGATTRMHLLTVSGGKVRFAASASVGWVNNDGGEISLADNSTLGLGGELGAGTYLQTRGSTSLDGASSRIDAAQDPDGGVEIWGGTLVGDGVIAGRLTNAGKVGPGSGIGTLTVEGDYTQLADGTLAMEADAPRSDGLAVRGAAALGGTLLLTAPSGFEPPRDGLQLITTKSLKYRFAKVDRPQRVDVEYRPNGVLLLPAAGCDAPQVRLRSPRQPTLLDAMNLSRSFTRSLFPKIARVPDGMGVVWLEERSGITFRRIGDDGSASSPLTLDAGAGEYSRWDVASSGPFVYVVWEQRQLDGSPEGYDSEIWLAASRDGGRSFSAAVQLSRTPRETSWFPKVAASGEHVSVVWSDRGTLVHVQSNDGGATFPDDTRNEVTQDVQPGGYDVAQSGSVPYIAWRGFVALPGGGTGPRGPVFVASSRDGGKTLVSRSVDQTGPMSGVPIVAADGEMVYVVFGQGPSDLRVASSRAGSDWSVSTLAGPVGDVSVAAADGAAVVAWSGDGQTFARTSPDGGGFGDTVEVAPGYVEDVAISEGRVHVATRNFQPGVAWQIVLASSADGGATYERTSGAAFSIPRLGCGNHGSVLPRVAAFGDAFAVAWNDMQITNAPPFYGDFEVGYRSGFLADPDLELIDVQAVQAADDADNLVADKPTVVRAKIKSTIPESRAVTIRLRYRYQGTGGFVDQTVTDSVVLRPGTPRVSLPLSSEIEPQGHDLEYVVTIDPADAIPESDEQNNERTRVQPVKDTKPLRVLVAPVHVAGEPPVACADVFAVAERTERYLDATFPLAPIETRFDHRCAPIEINDERYDNFGLRSVFRPLETAGSTAGYDKAIGVVRKGWFDDHTVSQREAVALSPFNSEYDAVLTERQNTGGWPVVHELAHNMGWVADGTPGATGHHQNNVPAPGYWVGARQALDRIDFMHDTTSGADPTNPTGRWIAKSTWDYLLGKLAVDPADPPVIAITGVVRSDGSVHADPWYAVDGTVDAPLGSTGELGVRFLDGDGNVIATAGFDATHELTAIGAGQNSGELDSAPFAVNVPAVAGTAAIQITRGGDVIYQRDRSANAPAVEMTQPAPGTAFRPGDKVEVAWTSADADGDPLTQLVQLSTDGGRTWLPLGEDVTDSTFSFTVPTLAAVSTARLRVIATDGLNTTEALSPEFTIGEAAKIAFTRMDNGQCRHQLYTINTDGSDAHKLSTCDQVDGLQIEDNDPSWSPDGRRIAYERYDGCCDRRIYVMNADGSDAHVVINTPGSWDEHPDWSPQSDEIVFENNAALPDGGLSVVRSDGTGLRHLGVFGFKPSWSPDGAKIAYILNSTLRIINADGSGDHAVTSPFVDSASAPSWSPDGARIAFVGEHDEEIYVMSADGSDVHQLPERGFDPAWSPAGELLAFSCRCPQADFKLFTMAPDGSDLTALTGVNIFIDTEADWQPAAGEPPPLAVDAGGPYDTEEGQPVPVRATASGPDSRRVTYGWDLDADSEYDDKAGTAAAPMFPDDGTFTVGVRVRNDSGQIAADTAPVDVSNVPPTIVSASATIDEAHDVLLRAHVTDPGTADVLTAAVDWGDGTPPDDVPLIRERDAYAVEATHHYAAADSSSVTLDVADDDGGRAARTLPLAAAPPNRAPVADGQQVGTHVDVPLALELAAIDPDGDPVRLRVVRRPSHGRVTELPRLASTPLRGDSNFVYTPDAGYVGDDRFTFVANDGLADSGEAAVSVTIRGDQPHPAVPTPAPAPAGTPTPAPAGHAPPGAAAQLLLACSGRDVALIDVLPAARGRVVVTGVARLPLAGRGVAILLDGRRVGRTIVDADGRFRAVVAAPARSRRPRARYQARMGRTVSKKLRLERRMVATQVRVRGGKVELRGRITAPFARRPAPIILERFRTCTDRERVNVGRVVPNRHGRFVIRFPVPADAGPTLYRARTKVAVRRGRPPTEPTFTLPQPVDL
jgi:Tol biopolymer transport system component